MCEDLLPGTNIDDLVADLLVLEDLGDTAFLDRIADEVSARLSEVRTARVLAAAAP